MTETTRRDFLRLSTQALGAVGAAGLLPGCIRQALAIPAARETGSIHDVKHVVILMQENRSFDHYFGTLRGVRGFGDRHPLPLASGHPVWMQSDGQRIIPPYHLDTATTSGLRVPGTPHSFDDAQAAWNQGKFGFWPRYKTEFSMGHFRREDIPFQFALTEAFTLCDAYHCSVTAGTDPNRIVYWSGSSGDPALRARGIDCTDTDGEPDNLRCWVKGALPEPGYTYQGSALKWQTLPEVLQGAGIDWRIYQDPNDNWTGAMHGGLAFAGFRNAKPGEPLYERGMRHWWLEQFAEDVRKNRLPEVCWVLPPKQWSEHPSASSPLQGAEFTARVLDALTANPEVWSRTAVFLTFDENDGQFDHVPPPAPPSWRADGTLAGKATLDLRGHYFSDPERKHLNGEDTISGTLRPWGLGPRVPMYVISPWSSGGWVNSQVFDHTSVGQFLEKRFDVSVPGISAWHRAVCGDLTGCFDFSLGERKPFPTLPDVSNSTEITRVHEQRPKPLPPAVHQRLFQEPGVRPSRALPYRLDVQAQTLADSQTLRLVFINEGSAGVVFHVYDRRHLDRIPRRYTVEAGQRLDDLWSLAEDEGAYDLWAYDLWVYAPNGFVREFAGGFIREYAGHLPAADAPAPEIVLGQDATSRQLVMTAHNAGTQACQLVVRANAYHAGGPWTLALAPGQRAQQKWSLEESRDWYDLSAGCVGFSRRYAGRIETGADGLSDPAMAQL